MKRVLLLGFALIFAAGLLAGCGGSKPAPEKQGEKTLSLVLDGVASRQHELEAVAQYLKKVGVDAQVRVWEKNALLNEIKAGNRMAYAQDWGSAIFDPFDLGVPKLKTKDRGNYSFYSNPKFDELLEKGAFGDNDQEREKAYKEAQQILYQDAPWIFGYYLDIIQGVSANVQGYKPAMDNRINLHDVSLGDGKDTLAVGLNIDRIPSLDPANHREREAETVIRNMFDGLVTRTPEGKVVPEIAESWKRPSPAVTLGAELLAIVARISRSSMVEVLRHDYVQLARSKGLKETAVIFKHALPNALIPTVTVVGLQMGVLLGGNMIVETVFGWPGLGRLVVQSIFARDYTVIQGAVMLYGVTFILANLLVDIVYTYLNPKISL